MYLPGFLVGSLFLFVANAQLDITRIEWAKTSGFLTNASFPQIKGSDAFKATLCFCASPQQQAPNGAVDEGHLYKYEYFNNYLNESFELRNICKLNHAVESTCLKPKRHTAVQQVCADFAGMNVAQPLNATTNQTLWGTDDSMCVRGKLWKAGHVTLEFNNRTVSLAHGYQELEDERVNQQCGQLCHEYTGMPSLTKKHSPKSRIYSYMTVAPYYEWHST